MKMAAFRKSLSHGHEANELEAFVNIFENREMEEITWLSHVTDDEKFRKALEKGSIDPKKIEEPYWSRLAHEDAPTGVMFEPSLFHSEMQEKSRYGDTRLKLPCHFVLHNMVHPRLFLETFYYFKSSPKNQYARLILVDGGTQEKEYQWCMNNCLRRVNHNDNDILILDRDRHRYYVTKNDGLLFPYIWVELFVVGGVRTMAVDSLVEVLPSKVEPTPGVVPPLRIRGTRSDRQ